MTSCFDHGDRIYVAGGVRSVVAAIVIGLTAGACAPPERDASLPAAGGNETVVTARPTIEAAVHPQSTLTVASLDELVSVLPAPVRAAVMAKPQVFLEQMQRLLALDVADAYLLRHVDKEFGLEPDFAPADLVWLRDYRDRLVLNRNDLALRRGVMPYLLAMVEAARLDGVVLDVSSTYRSYEYQSGLFARHVATLGENEARRQSAEPGHSQHQLGTVVDFGSITPAFADHPAGRWLAANAAEFGFSLSYPAGQEALTGYMYEPWHYRFITPVAAAMEQAFFAGSQQLMLSFLRTHAAAFQAAALRAAPAGGD